MLVILNEYIYLLLWVVRFMPATVTIAAISAEVGNNKTRWCTGEIDDTNLFSTSYEIEEKKLENESKAWLLG